MVTLAQQPTQISSTALIHWWRYMLGEHRLFFRLVNESLENLSRLPYLKAIIKKLNSIQAITIAFEYPPQAEEIRLHLLSALRYFIGCLQALLTANRCEAEMLYNLVHADLSMLQYIFMTQGIKSYV